MPNLKSSETSEIIWTLAVSCLKYCRYSIKLYPINQSVRKNLDSFFSEQKDLFASFRAWIKYCGVYKPARSSTWPLLYVFSKDTGHKKNMGTLLLKQKTKKKTLYWQNTLKYARIQYFLRPRTQFAIILVHVPHLPLMALEILLNTHGIKRKIC